MNSIKTGGWLFLSLFMLGFFSWYQASTLPTAHLNTETLANIPDQRITHLSVQRFDNTGQLLHSLKTPLMQHTPYQNTHWFKHPLIKVTEPNQPAWDIQSEEAIATHNGEHITFQHQVLIKHHAYENNPPGTIKTELIHYFPKKKFATTDAKITWSQVGNTAQATGMNAYLDEHRIDLLNHARATYDPVG
jgi:lipopolysaccharide export system protein LptC